MTHITLPTDETRRLPFYLAMEEYVASQKGDLEEAFFLWQVEPTVIFGRHQVIENEVNIPYCREHGIQFYRRKSGGGCVYADKSNVMMSMTPTDQTIADLMTDGCNMGVKSLNRYLNEYGAAEEYAKDMAKKLIHLEQQLATDLRQYL